MAYWFVVESDYPDVESFERVDTRHPDETYGTQEGLTVTEIRPLFSMDDDE